VQTQIDDLQNQVTALNVEITKIDPENATTKEISMLQTIGTA
jgi:hypothetical protein